VNLPWIWGIAKFCFAEIDVQKKLETGELDAFILGIAEIDASEIERASGISALERFERSAARPWRAASKAADSGMLLLLVHQVCRPLLCGCILPSRVL
jgi:hypothetical protein